MYFMISVLPSLTFASSFTTQVKVVGYSEFPGIQCTKGILKKGMYFSINYMEVFPCSSEVQH